MEKTKLLKTIAAIAIILAAMAVPVATAEAKGEKWKSPGNGWHYLEGTDVTVEVGESIIRVHGTGAIPDYDYWTLSERPWGRSNCQYLFIDDTITSIGKYAFYRMEELKHISINTKTFIADTTTFDKIAYKPIFRLRGEEETVKMIGTIPFTSYDSIKRMAQVEYNGAAYILDTQGAARRFQDSTNPTIQNVYHADDEKAPWADVDMSSNGLVQTPLCWITTPGVSKSYVVSAEQFYQGDACYEAYAAFIGDYTFATTFNIDLLSGGKILDNTPEELQYTLLIPLKNRAAGKSFRLLAIGSGVVNIYDDLDADDATITFVTNTPTTSYALVYK